VPVPDPAVARRCRARWWEVRPERVAAIEGPSFGLDPTIARLDGDGIDRNRDLRGLVEKLGVEPEDLLAYLALADGPFGRYRVAAVFPRPPGEADPVVLCLDGPRGFGASEHRNGEAALCLYYWNDPPERRWTEGDRLVRLFDLARQHLACEHVFRQTGRWPIEEAPHGETAPTPRDPSLALPPLRWPNRNRACPCGSGRKAKRCCFR
jgi:hypothetical protein